MQVIKPPVSHQHVNEPVSVFTAGTIDMGQAEDWQARFEEHFKDHDITVLNPRRDNWDYNIEQTITNPVFNEQVNWELDGLITADIIALYFVPGSTSIITMMELGMFAYTGKIIAYCPDDFWRRGNVEVCAARNPITVTNDETLWLQEIEKRIERIVQDQNKVIPGPPLPPSSREVAEDDLANDPVVGKLPRTVAGLTKRVTRGIMGHRSED